MLVSRKREQKLLLETLESDESKLVAIYGRRRVGKTYLVRETFGRSFTFQHSGFASGSLEEQLFAFCVSLNEYGLEGFERPRNWLEAFELLKKVIRRAPDGKKVVFIDELSWMDTPGSDLMVALEGFWNGWASARTDVVMVLCASGTSWMLNKVVHNKGGLYNRLSIRIHLEPFTLAECEEYAHARGLVMNHNQLLECYMIMGGVPYYWSFLNKSLGVSQNIDALFFSKNALLEGEFEHLYSSLFKRPEPYLAIIEALSARKSGLTRKELVAATKSAQSGAITARLEELESCGFIRKYRRYGKKTQGAVYQLVDCFTLFYYKFLKDRPTDEHFWTNNLNSGTRNAWLGLAFERVCFDHVPQIKRALGINGVLTDLSAWSCESNPDEGIFGSQIDLLIARKDQVINLCEMKFSADEYAVTKEVDAALRHKVSDFCTLSKTRCAIHVTIITPYGLRQNMYSGNVQAVVIADDLFERA